MSLWQSSSILVRGANFEGPLLRALGSFFLVRHAPCLSPQDRPLPPMAGQGAAECAA